MKTLDWLTSDFSTKLTLWLGVGEGDLGGLEFLAAGKGLEGGAELGFHGGGVEVAGDGDDDVVGDDGSVVPGLEVVEGDGVDGGVFGLARVGAVGAIGEFDGFADGDAGGVVVAAGDGGFELALWRAGACRP